MSGTITVRRFRADEWQAFKNIRLKALETDPHVFGASLEDSRAYPDKKWQEDVMLEHVGIFGVFAEKELIGMTGIAKLEEEGAAVLWGSWLEPVWRGKGVSEKMYAARLDWAHERADITHIVVSHRESNVESRRANQKAGFKYTYSKPRTWHDGMTEDEMFYRLDLCSIS